MTGQKEMANILQQQFCSVFSDPNNVDTSAPTFNVPPIVTKDTEIVQTQEDIEEAISEIKLDSAPGPDGIPAILLKRCASTLSLPIYLLWSESMRTGVVPKFYKTGYISSLFKKGSRCEAGNYRPVTLTSHIVKVFERVVRKHMVNYLEDNSLLTDKQHGFRSGRSCLTQILDHFDDIYEGFTRGEDTDFILFINDLEQVVLLSKVSFFADDTRVSKRIGCHDDCLMLREDLYHILEWSRNNNMKLHEQKFELLNHQQGRTCFTLSRKSETSELWYRMI